MAKKNTARANIPPKEPEYIFRGSFLIGAEVQYFSVEAAYYVDRDLENVLCFRDKHDEEVASFRNWVYVVRELKKEPQEEQTCLKKVEADDLPKDFGKLV